MNKTSQELSHLKLDKKTYIDLNKPTDKNYVTSSEDISQVLPSLKDFTSPFEFGMYLYQNNDKYPTFLSSIFSKDNKEAELISEAYLSNFDFSGISLDLALRIFLGSFDFEGETQEKSRILEYFSSYYYLSNTSLFHSKDACFSLVFSLILLNTDLHNSNVEKKMTYKCFLKNNHKLNGGLDFDEVLQKTMYDNIKEKEIIPFYTKHKILAIMNEKNSRNSFKFLSPLKSKYPHIIVPSSEILHTQRETKSYFSRTVKKLKSNVQSHINESVTLFFAAYISKSSSNFGVQTWNRMYASINNVNMTFYRKRDNFSSYLFHFPILNSFASVYKDDLKHKRFSLITNDYKVYIFQAESKVELDNWILVINTIAAKFSYLSMLQSSISSKSIFAPPCHSTKIKIEDIETRIDKIKKRMELVEKTLKDLNHQIENDVISSSIHTKVKYYSKDLVRLQVYLEIISSTNPNMYLRKANLSTSISSAV